MADNNTNFDTAGQPFIGHLMELRTRLLKGVGSVVVVFICLVPFANDLYEFLAKPLMQSLPAGDTMIATQPHGTFLVPFKFAFALAIAISIPVLLYQIWAFISPGLYSREKRLAMPMIVSSTLLFYFGVLFCYFVVFPLVFAFFAGTTPEGVAMMTDINEYLGFVLKMFFAFGVAFEVPVATVLLLKAGITTIPSLKAKRPYIIVAAFVMGMLLTPPDVFSQVLLAIPVWLLFEVGLIFAKRLGVSDVEVADDLDEDLDPTSGS